MSQSAVYFVGSSSEVEHHAAPLKPHLAVRVVSADEVVQLAQPGELAIFFSEHFDRFRSACQQLKQNNVATLYLIDGIIEWRNAWENRIDEPACPYTMRPILSHKAACIGAAQARLLDSWGNSEKTEIVGIPRFDPLLNLEPVESTPEVFRILVMTAKTPAFTAEQYAMVKRSLLDLKQWFDSPQGQTVDGRAVQVTWRLTGGLDQEIEINNKISDLSGNDLAHTLAGVDAVITTPSTAMLEGMLVGRPVAALNYFHSPQYLKTAWNIHARQQIGSVIHELANPSQEKMFFQQTELQDQLHEPTTATDRLVELITRMSEIATTQVANQQNLTFPEHLLPVANQNQDSGREFDYSQLFPNDIEFSCQDKGELQSELAHARREIKHLHRQILQLQSELDQAHQIFSEIQGHPIAGPIVRVRQRILDWIHSFKQRNQQRDSTTSST